MDFDIDGEELAQLGAALAEAAPDALNLVAGIIDVFNAGLVTGDDSVAVTATGVKGERQAKAQEPTRRSSTAPPAEE